MLIKVNASSIQFSHPIIQHYLIKNKIIFDIILLDYRSKIRINHNNFIPFNFCGNIIFISSHSFMQNNIYISPIIRNLVIKFINFNNFNNFNNILCIGGESYIYGLVSKYKNIYHFTNSKSIFDDCSFNSIIYKKSKNIFNNLIDYNSKNINKNINSKINFDICILNLSNLNHNLLKIINKIKINFIIIINCHHSDFWKKIKLLSNYKLVNRQHIICHKLKYFITFNILSNNTL
jgi:hypothetical protein